MRNFLVKWRILACFTILLFCCFSVGVSAAEPTISISPTLPTVYVNDHTGQGYSITLENMSGEQANNLSIELDIIDSGSGLRNTHFAYMANSLQVLLNGMDITSQVTLDGPGPWMLTVDPAVVLQPTDRMVVNFTLTTDAFLEGGTKNLFITKVSTTDLENTVYSFTDEEIITVLPGILVVEVSPIAPLPFQAERGETITLQAEISNQGAGVYFFDVNHEFVTSWGDGLVNPQIIPLQSNAVPTLQGNSYVLGLTRLDPGQSLYFQFTLDVQGYANFAIDALYHNITTNIQYTDALELVLEVKQPSILVQVLKTAAIQYGTDASTSDTMELQIINQTANSGAARSFKLLTDFDPNLVNVVPSAGWIYDPVTKILTFTDNGGIIPGNGSVNLVLTLTPNLSGGEIHCSVHNEDDSNTFETYDLALIPQYKNDLEKVFTTKLVRSTYTITNIPTITLERIFTSSSDGDYRRVFLNEPVTYKYVASITDVNKWGSAQTITFTTTVPKELIINSITVTTTAQPTTVTTVEGTAITWEMTPAEAALLGGQTLTIQATATSNPALAGRYLHHWAELKGYSIAGCKLQDENYMFFYLQSREEEMRFTYESKSITNLPGEQYYDVTGAEEGKDLINYEVHYEFDPTSSGVWTGSTYTDKLDRAQEYVVGTAKYMIDGGVWTSVPEMSIISTSPLTIDLSFITGLYGNDNIMGKKLDLSYTLKVSGNSLSPVYLDEDDHAKAILSQSDLMVVGAVGGHIIAGQHHFYQGVFVPVSRARLEVDLSMLTTVADTVAKGEPLKVKVELNKMAHWDNNNVTITVDLGDNYAYLGNPVLNGLYAQVPAVNEVDVDFDEQPEQVKFTFANFEVNQVGIIGDLVFDVVKTQTSSSLITATVNYTDDIGQPFSHSDQETVKYLLSANLDILAIPANVDLSNNTVSWIYEVVNMGNGVAYNTFVTENLKDILTYTGSTIGGIAANPDTSVNLDSITLKWSLGDLQPGQVKRIEVGANTHGSSSNFTLASTAFATFGWYKDLVYNLCQTVEGNDGNDFPAFRQPTSISFIANDNVDGPFNLNESGILKLRVVNTGLTNNYNIEIRQNLGIGFRYKSGTATIEGVPILDPLISGNELIWTYKDTELNYLHRLVEMSPGDSFIIEYEVETTDAFSTNNLVESSSTWQKPWEVGGLSRTGSSTGADYSVPRRQPYMRVIAVGKNVTAGDAGYMNTVTASIGDRVEWKVTVENTVGASISTAYNAVLEHVLPPNMTIESIKRDSVIVGNLMIGNLAPGAMTVYQVTATFDGPCQPAANYTASVRWGKDTSALTAPGVRQDSAVLVTQPKISQVSQTITDFTTKGGLVVITIEHTGAVMQNLVVTDNLTDRFALKDVPIQYSASLGIPTSAPIANTVGNAPLTWTFAGPIVAGTHTITFELQDANLGASNGDPLTPFLSVAYENIAGEPQLGVSENGTSFDPKKAELVIEFSAAKPRVQSKKVGEAISWEMIVKNIGDADATDVEIIDTLGDGYTYSSSTPYQDQVGNQYTWNNLSIPAGGQLTILMNATVNGPGDHTQEISAKEKALVSDVSVYITNAFTTVFGLTMTIDQNTGPARDPIADAPGEIVNITLTANFTGSDLYENVTITNLLPTGINFVGQTLPVDFPSAVTSNHVGKSLTWNVGNFTGPQTLEINYSVRVTREGLITGNVITNTAETSFQITPAFGETLTFNKVSHPSLKDSKSFTYYTPIVNISARTVNPVNGANVEAGREIAHSLKVSNIGGAFAYDVNVRDILPAGIRGFDPMTAPITITRTGTDLVNTALVQGVDYSVSYDNLTGYLIFKFLNTDISILGKGEYYTINYKNQVDSDISAGLSLTYSGSITQYLSQPFGTTGNGFFPVSPSNQVTYHTIDSSYTLTRLQPVDGTVAPGETAVYRLTFTVPDGTSVFDVGLENQLPAGLVYVEGSAVGPIGGAGLGAVLPQVTGDSSTGQTLSWFGSDTDITNTTGIDQTYTIEFSATAMNTTLVVQGNQLTNRAVYNFNTNNDTPASRTNHTALEDSLTVVEPDLTLTKTVVSVGPYEAGDIVTFRVSVSNPAAGEIAYDAVVTETLPVGLSYTGFTLVSGDPGPVSINGQQLTWGGDLLDLSGGENLVFEITAEITSSVEPSQGLSSSTDLSWTSVDGVTAEDRTYSKTANAAINTANITNLTKIIINPSLVYTVGQTFTYRLVLDLTNGTTDQVVITDTLAPGLILVSSSITKHANTNYTLLAEPANGATGELNWNFGTVTNTAGVADEIVIDLVVQVANTLTNQASSVLTSSAVVRYLDSADTLLSDLTGDVSITLREPAIVVLKEVRNITKGDLDFTAVTVPDAGDELEYRVTVSNDANASTAYDLQFVDTFNAGLRYMTNSLRQTYETVDTLITPNSAGTGEIGSPQSIWWGNNQSTPLTINLPAGKSVIYTYHVEVLDHVGLNQTLTNSINLEWTSVEGTVSGERDGSGGLNDYHDSKQSTIQTLETNVLTSIERAADTYNTDSPDLRVGDLVTYVISVGLQEGTTQGLSLTAELPVGLKYVRTVSINGDVEAPYSASLPLAYHDIPLVNLPTVGARSLVWSIGEVANTGDNLINDEFVIVFEAQVTQELAQMPLSQTLQTSANLSYTGKTTLEVVTNRTVNVQVVQPLLSILQNADPTAGSNIIEGQQITYTLTVTNTGLAPAYDLQLQDVLPAEMREQGLAGVVVETVKINGLDKVVKSPVDNADYANNGQVFFDFDDNLTADTYTLQVGDTLEIVYNVRANSSLPTGAVVSNSAQVVSYASFDDDASPAGAVTADRVIYGPSVNAVVSHTTIAPPGVPVITGPASSNVTIGEELTYQIQVPGAGGVVDTTMYDLETTVLFPANVEFVGAVFGLTNQAEGVLAHSLNGNTLILTGIDRVQPNTSAIIELTVRVKNIVENQAGTIFNLSASYTYELNDGAADNFSGGSYSANNATIVEPALTILKEVRNVTKNDPDFTQLTAPDTGDKLEFRVTVENILTSTAYDLNFTDLLSEGLQYVNGTLKKHVLGVDTAIVPGLSGTGGVGDAQTILWGRDQLTPVEIDLAAGQVVVFTYQVEVMNTVTVGQFLHNSVTVDWTSLNGAIAAERTNAGGVDDYTTNDSVMIQADDNNSVNLVRTADTFNTGTADVRIGDLLTFTLTIGLQEGTIQGLSVSSVLPVGLEFVDTISIAGDTSAPFSASNPFSYVDIAAVNTPTDGEHSLVWNLGDVVNLADNMNNDTLQIVYRARVTKNFAQLPVAQNLQVEGNFAYTGKVTSADVTKVLTSVQVKQPQLTIVKSADPATGSNVMANQLIRYTLTVTNTGVAPAYDMQIKDTIAEGLRANGVTLEQISINGLAKPLKASEPNADFITNGEVVWNLDNGISADTYTLLPGEVLELTYTVRADNNLASGLSLASSAVVQYYASIDDDALPTDVLLAERGEYGPTEGSTVTYQTISLPGQPVLTAPVSGTIGEELVYQMQIPGNGSVVATTMYDVTAEIVLPDNVEFVGTVFADGNLAVGTLSSNVVGNTVTITGIDTVPINSQAVLALTLRVKNLSQNQAGNAFTLDALYTYELSDGGVDNFPGGTAMWSTTVLEPQLTVVQEVLNLTRGEMNFADTTTFDAGDRLKYRVALTNGTTNASSAYDLNLSNTLPEGFRYTAGSLVQVETGNTPITPDITGTGEIGVPQTLTWGRTQVTPVLLTLAPGETRTYTYEIVVQDSVGVRQNLTNNFSVDWTSLDGTIAAERNGAGGLNDYLVSDTLVVQSDDVNTITLNRSSDTFNPGVEDVRVGDLITYILTLNLQEGTTEGLVVAAELPLGLEFVDTVSMNGDLSAPFSGHGVFSYPDIPITNTPAVGATTLTWNLGTVTNVGDNLQNDELVIVYRAKVTKSLPQNVLTQTLETRANLNYVGKSSAAEVSEVSTVVELNQPLLTFTKTANPAENCKVMAGQEISYTLSILNTGTAPAYDIQIVDTLPLGMRQGGVDGVIVEEINIQGNSKPLKNPLVNANFALDGKLVWNLDDLSTPDLYTLLPTETLQLVYTVRVDNNLVPGAALSNSAVVESYYSLDNGNLPQGSMVADRAQYASLTPAVVTHQTIATPGALTIVGPTVGTIGEEVTYQLKMPGDGHTVDAVMYDLAAAVTLPANVQLVSATFANSNQAAGTLAYTLEGQALTLTGMNTVQASEQAVIDVIVRIIDDVINQAGTQFSLGGAYSYELQSGGTDHFAGVTANSNLLSVIEPELRVVRTGPEFMRVGTPGEFTLNVTNAGTSTAWQVDILELLPVEMRNIPPTITQITVGEPARVLQESLDYEQLYTPETGEWRIGLKSSIAALAEGEMLTIRYQAELNQEDFANILISNIVLVEKYYSLDTQGGLPLDVRVYDEPGEAQTATANVTIQSPLITAEILVDKPLAEPGEQIHYTVVLTNNGNIAAENVTLTVNMAQEYAAGTLQGIICDSGTVVAEESAGGVNGKGTFTVANILIPEAGGSITVQWDVQLESVIPNQAIIHNTVDLQIPAVIGQIPFTSEGVTIKSAPLMTLDKLDDNLQLNPGDSITYTLRITNTGNATAHNVVVIDQVPSNTCYVAGSTQLNGEVVEDQGQLPLAEGLQIGSVAVGEELILEFTVTTMPDVVLGTIISNQAILRAEGETVAVNPELVEVVSDDPATPAANDPTRSVVGGFPILDSQKTVTDDNGGLLEQGDTLTYTIYILNQGSADATGVALSDKIPEETSYISGTLYMQRNGQPVSNVSDEMVQGRDIAIQIGTLQPEDLVKIEFKVLLDTAVDGQILFSQGLVTSNELPDEPTDADGNDSNGDQPTEIIVGTAPALRATMQVQDLNGDSVVALDMVEYTIAISNIGTEEATGVNLRTIFPIELSYLPQSTLVEGVVIADGADDSSAMENGLGLGNIGAQEALNIRFRVIVAADVTQGTSIDLQAIFTSNEGLSGVTDSDLDDGVDNQQSRYVQHNPTLFVGIDANNDDSSLNDDDPTRLQIGSNPGTANITGTVWFDTNHDDQYVGEDRAVGWVVEIYQRDKLIDTTFANPDGSYRFRGLPPGSGYKLYFRQPESEMVHGDVTDVSLHSGETAAAYDYPIEPTGYVYDSIIRTGVGGAAVSLAGPEGFDPALHLLPGQQGQVTGQDGAYKFELSADAPIGDYTIEVVPPVTYSPVFPSTTILPEQGTLIIDPTAVVAGSYLVVGNNLPPARDDQTRYYLSFRHTNGAFVVVNNHIPVDPILAGSILLGKKANKSTASVGDFVLYTVTVESRISAVITPFAIVDHLPAGFKYVAGSARINGLAVEPTGQAELTWSDLTLQPDEPMTITYLLVVGTGVREGNVYRNRAFAQHDLTAMAISNVAVADVQVILDPRFESALIIGKVFTDLNADGIQQEGEPGIQGVRIYTLAGKWIVTDEFGRFHLTDVGNGMFRPGKSVVLKIDMTSLPDGAKLTTANPIQVNLTGIMQKVNFGVEAVK